MAMTGNQQPTTRNRSASSATKETGGLQLLSPTLQSSIQKKSSVLSSSQPPERFGWSTTPPSSKSKGFDSEKSDGFDFDGFTLASVRGKKNPSDRRNSRQTRASSDDDISAYYYNDLAASKPPNPLSCSTSSAQTTRITDDFDLLERSRRSRLNSLGPDHKSFSRSGINARQSGVTSATAAAAGWPMAKKKEQTNVVTNGWLQKRKGLVLKRWKSYYCLLKSDDSLCLYASEDTVNGRLEQRYQILRVVLTDKNDSFHIIGVDADGAPRREEFRAGVPTEWTRWFQVLHKFFDTKSLEQAFVRKPELTFAPTISDKGSDCSAVSSNEILSMMPNYQPYDERRSYFTTQKSLYGGSIDDQTSIASSFSSSSAFGQVKEIVPSQKVTDCPMIERESQNRVPMLEIRNSASMLKDPTAAA